MNKKLKHACGEEKILRLVKREKAFFDDKKVHETLQVKSEKVGLLTGILWHDSFQRIDAMLNKLNQYTSLAAADYRECGKKA